MVSVHPESLSRDQLYLKAEVKNGCLIKILTEHAGSYIQRIPFFITKEGIYIADCDSKTQDSVSTTCIRSFLKRENFSEYYCSENKTISIEAAEFKKNITNGIKKKESLTIYLRKDVDEFGNPCVQNIDCIIKTENSKESAAGTDWSYIPAIEEPDLELIQFPPDDLYYYPLTLHSKILKKMKQKLNGKNSTLTIEMQANNFIRINSISGVRKGGGIQYGEIIHDKSFFDIEYSEDSDSEEDEYPYRYCADFSYSVISNNSKLSSLNNDVRFYAPRKRGVPFKIGLDIAVKGNYLGELLVFNKDLRQIEYENSLNFST